MNINIFSEKEIQVIEAMVPNQTAQKTIETVLRAWFDSNFERTYSAQKTKEEKLDEILAVSTAKAEAIK